MATFDFLSPLRQTFKRLCQGQWPSMTWATMTGTALLTVGLSMTMLGCQATNPTGANNDPNKPALTVFLPNQAQKLREIAVSYDLNVKVIEPNSDAALIFKALLNATSDKAPYFAVINTQQNRLVTAGNVPEDTPEANLQDLFKKIKQIQAVGVKQSSKLTPDKPDTLKLVIFSDYQCPYCRQIHEEAEAWQKQFGAPLEVEVAHFPLPMHPQALFLSESAECARNQGKFEEFNDQLFDNQTKLNAPDTAKALVTSLVSSLHMDPAAFGECMVQHKSVPSITDDQLLGQYLGVAGTPTLFVNGEAFQVDNPATMKATIKEKIEALSGTKGS